MEQNLKSLTPKIRLELTQVEGKSLLMGIRKDGKKYSVREHRMSWFYPKVWIDVYSHFGSTRSKLTADILLRTGSRINEARHIEKDDCDFDRNNITLRVTKAKARKGEKKGKPRTLPMDTKFMRKLKKEFDEDNKLNLLSTPAFNIALHQACKEAGLKDYYNYSAHSIRKTHGNWLKILGNLGLMQIDATEICLRLGHDYNTFLKDYGSAGVLSNEDIQIAKGLMGDLYSRKNN